MSTECFGILTFLYFFVYKDCANKKGNEGIKMQVMTFYFYSNKMNVSTVRVMHHSQHCYTILTGKAMHVHTARRSEKCQHHMQQCEKLKLQYLVVPCDWLSHWFSNCVVSFITLLS